MVGFGRQLAAESRPEWSEFYLDYSALKRLIRRCKDVQQRQSQQQDGQQEQQQEQQQVEQPSVHAVPAQQPSVHVAPDQLPARQLERQLDEAKAAFQRRLDAEVLKVIGFYRRRSLHVLEAVDRVSQDVRSMLAPERQNVLQRGATRAAALDWLAAGVQEAVQEITQLLQYISLNMTAVRKVLKKFAKNVAGQTKQPAPGFLALEIEHPDDPGWRVLQGTFLPSEVAGHLQDMQQHEPLLHAMQRLQGLVGEVARSRAALMKRDSMRSYSQGEHTLGDIAGEVEQMQEAEEEASRHSALVHAVPWMERAAGMFEPPPPDVYAVATLSGLVLNNLSSLLYMANYTAVLPPTDALCVRIGVPSSYTGYIMAASDLAALFASVGISFWTQRSFKQPLLFAGAACLTGNLLFILSYERRSLALLLLARLLNGTGSARAANRRYTADFVQRSQRTMASAAFVGASNLGMALGPLLSLPLSYLPDDASGARQLGGVALNPVTAVGLVMALCWAAFLVAAAIWFADPPARLPIGLARGSTLLLGTSSEGPSLAGLRGLGGSSGRSSAAPSSSSLREPLLLPSLPGMPGGPSVGQQPADVASLLDDVEAAATADAAGRAQEEDGAIAGVPVPLPPLQLLPHAQRAQQQEGAVAADKRRAEAAAAAWRATIPGTLACTLALFVQKMVQQGYLDSLPVSTQVLYSWHAPQAGLFLGLVSLGMVPVNAAVGAASARLSDRSMVLSSLALCLLCLLCLALGSVHSAAVFFGAGVLLFVGTVVLEGTATSLMSKCIWRGFAQGVLNAGLLSTEAGTFGRFAGNAVLALAGRLTGLGDKSQLAAFARLLHLTLAAVCAALLVHLACVYRYLKG